MNLVKKTDFDNKLLGFNKRSNSNKTKYVFIENELNELTKKVGAISKNRLIKDLINGYKILNGARQNHLIYFSCKKYFGFFTSNTSKVLSRKSIGLSEKSIENITTSDRNFAPTLMNYRPLSDIKFIFIYLINNNDPSLDAVN